MAELSLEEVQRKKYELWSESFDVELAAATPATRLVAEGDSWFDYPPGLDILDNLKLNHGYKIYKVADAGDTVENMVYGTEIRDNFTRKPPQITETLKAITDHTPKAVLFSGGGNDIAGYELESFLNHKDSSLPVLRTAYAQDVFNNVFKKAYEDFFQKVWALSPNTHIVGHGYGRPIPDGRGVTLLFIRFSGPWLRPALAKKGVENASEARQVMAALMDLFNGMLASLALAHPKFHYIDLRTLIQDADWVNELHLSNGAYKRVADQFHAVIQGIP